MDLCIILVVFNLGLPGTKAVADVIRLARIKSCCKGSLMMAIWRRENKRIGSDQVKLGRNWGVSRQTFTLLSFKWQNKVE